MNILGWNRLGEDNGEDRRRINPGEREPRLTKQESYKTTELIYLHWFTTVS